MLQSGLLSTVANLADALTRGIRAPGVDGADPLWGVVAVGSVGALFLLGLMGRRTLRVAGFGRTIRKALPMLPPDVRTAVTAALREHEKLIAAGEATPADQPARAESPVAVPASVPPYLFVVRQDQPRAFSSLRDLAWSRPDLLGVVYDRRWMGDRRCKLEPGGAERRRAERRRAGPGRSWTRLGFLLVRPPARSRRPLAPRVPAPRAVRGELATRAELAGTAERAVSSARTASAGARARPRSGRRGVALGLAVLLTVAAASASVVHLGGFDRVTEMLRPVISVGTSAAFDRVAEVRRAVSSVGTSAAFDRVAEVRRAVSSVGTSAAFDRVAEVLRAVSSVGPLAAPPPRRPAKMPPSHCLRSRRRRGRPALRPRLTPALHLPRSEILPRRSRHPPPRQSRRPAPVFRRTAAPRPRRQRSRLAGRRCSAPSSA